MKADLIFILIVSITVFIGYRRGFIKSFLSLFYIIFSTFGCFLIYPFISDILKDTAVYTTIFDKIVLALTEKYTQIADGSQLTEMFLKYNVDKVNDLVNSMSSSITNVLVDIISAIMAFILIRVIIYIIKGVFGFVSKLPVIKSVDGLMGAILSFLSVMMVIFLFFAVILTPPCNESELSEKICTEVEKSAITKRVMNYNFFVNYESLKQLNDVKVNDKEE